MNSIQYSVNTIHPWSEVQAGSARLGRWYTLDSEEEDRHNREDNTVIQNVEDRDSFRQDKDEED